MKFALFFAFVAAVSALPAQEAIFNSPMRVPFSGENTKTIDIQLPQQYGQLDNIFHVAEYLAYQFSKAQQLNYTGEQVSQYLVEQGFPKVVAEYLAQQYEAGLNQTYFQTPYQIFQYYYKSGVSQEAQQYLAQQIAEAYQLYQNYLAQYGQQAYQQQYPGVPQAISQYVLEQGKYYNQNGVSYSVVRHSFQQMQQALQYAQNALQYFMNGQVSKQTYLSVYEQLTQAVQFVQNIQNLSLAYQTYQQYYIPYYAAQYYSQQVQQAYQYFQNAYLSAVKLNQGLPQYFVQQVQYAYLAAQKAYQAFRSSQSISAFEGTHNTNYVSTYPYQFGSNYVYGKNHFSQVSQYVNAIVMYVQRQAAQGIISEEFANYFIQKLGTGQQYSSQYHRLVEIFENLYQYVQQQPNVPQYVMQYLSEEIQNALEILQHYQYQHQGQYSPAQALIQSYVNKNYQYPRFQSQYQYGTPSTYGGVGLHSSPAYQYGSFGPYSTSAYQNSQYAQGYGYQPYRSTAQYGSYIPYQYQGSYPYAYSNAQMA